MAKQYRVTVEELKEPETDDKYDRYDTIYQQLVDDLTLINLIIAVNAIGSEEPERPPVPQLTLDPADDFREEQPPRNGTLIPVKEDENEDA
jgi:hypothetical protein